MRNYDAMTPQRRAEYVLALMMGWDTASSSDEEEEISPTRNPEQNTPPGSQPAPEPPQSVECSDASDDELDAILFARPLVREIPQPPNNLVNETTSDDDEDDRAITELMDELNAVRVEYEPGTLPCKYQNCATPTANKYCAFHQAPTCSAEGCSRRVFKGGKCRRHAGYVPPRCSVADCQNQAKVKGKCQKHGAPVKLCKFSGCDRRVKFQGLCHHHHPYAGLCIGCKLNTVKRKGDKCSMCSRPREHSAEHRIVRIVQDWYPNHEMKHSKVFVDRLRPDLVIKANGGVVIFEVDERQHNDPVHYPDETLRLIRLWKGSRTPMIIIRFNPDAHYDVQGNVIRICEEDRLIRLRELLDTVLEPRHKFPLKPELTFLFYDEARAARLEAEFQLALEQTA